MSLIDPKDHPIAFNLYHILWIFIIVAACYYLHLYSLPLLIIVAAVSSEF